MALEAYQGSFDAGASTGPIAVNDPGFQALATGFASIFTTGGPGVWGASLLYGYGGGTDTTQRSVTVTEQSGQTTSNTQRHSDIAALVNYRVGGPVDDFIAYTGGTANGFGLNVTQASTIDKTSHYTALGGTGVQFMAVPFTTGTTNVTGAGFAPEAALIFSVDNTDDASALDSTFCLGAIGSGRQWATCATADNAVPTMETMSNWRDDSCLSVINASTRAESSRAVWSAWTADGMTLSWPASSGTATHYALFMRGMQVYCNFHQQPAVNGLQTIPLGFDPKIAWFASSSTTIKNTVQAGYRHSFGGFDGTRTVAFGLASEDQATSSVCRRIQLDNRLGITHTDNGVTTGEAAPAFSNGNLNLTWSGITGGGNRLFGIFALGDTGVTPPTPVPGIGRARRRRAAG